MSGPDRNKHECDVIHDRQANCGVNKIVLVLKCLEGKLGAPNGCSTTTEEERKLNALSWPKSPCYLCH